MASVVVVASPAVRPRVVTRRASRPRTATIVSASASAPSSSLSTRRFALLTPALAGAFVAAIGAGSLAGPRPARADSLPDEQDVKLLCDAACEETLKTAELVTTPSGLQYRDVVVGDGAKPEPGFQARVLVPHEPITCPHPFVSFRRLIDATRGVSISIDR
jgi:peptidylprolyl isomerase